jgi:hypothetical protein
MPNKASIPFRVRSIPPKSTRAMLFESFSHETHLRLPPPHEFDRAVPGFGNEAQFFVGLVETDPTALIPGQPYSVYPKRIQRPQENRVDPKGAIQAARIEGPMIGIQWKVSDIAGKELCLPGNCRVPEEISLLQLFKIFITPKFRVQGIQIMWGNHYRGGDILEIGQVSSLEEGDLVEIIVDQGSAPLPTQVEVEYEIESKRFTICVDRSMTIEQLRKRLNYEHKGKRITAIASEGNPIHEEDPVEEWIQRTAGIPLTAVLPKTVQVIVDFRGVEKHFAVQDDVSEHDFKALVRNFVGLKPATHIAVVPLGLDEWAIRPGCTYSVAETRSMEVWVTDTAHGRNRLKLPGNATLNQACEIFKVEWHIPEWDDITIRRADKAPFLVEVNGEYTVTIVYNANKDLRPICAIKIVTSLEHKVYRIDGYRVLAPDPEIIWTDICSKYGFVNPGPSFLQISGHPDDGQITFTYRVPATVNNVRLPALTSRTFKIIDEDEWLSPEILSPEAWGREEIWAQLGSIRQQLSHFSQYHFSYALREIPATSRTSPPGHITVTRLKFPIRWRL